METKLCKVCEEEKSLAEYYFQTYTGKPFSKCKACTKVADKLYRLRNREKVNTRRRNYYQRNREKIVKYNTQYQRERRARLKKEHTEDAEV